MAANRRGASLEVTQQFLNQWSCSTECGWRSRSGLAGACSRPRPPGLRLPAGWVQGSVGSARVTASGDIMQNDSIYSPLSKNMRAGGLHSPPSASCPDPTLVPLYPWEIRCHQPRQQRGAAEEMGHTAPCEQFPQQGASLGNFRTCQFAKAPSAPPAAACKLRALPSFYLGRRGPATRSEECPAMPARPASCFPGCPGSWSRGNTPEIARKA